MRASFLIWLVTASYAIAATWAINAYWKHNVTMKIMLFTPLAGVMLLIMFEDQLWRVRHAIARRRALRAGPSPRHDIVTVHLRMEGFQPETEDRWDIYALQEELRNVIKKKKLGAFDGNEIAEDEAVLFMSGPDGEVMFAGIELVLRANPLCRNAIAKISRSDADSLTLIREVSIA